MRYATPEDPNDAPVWLNYVISQTSYAALGQIPVHAVALGVEVSGRQARLIVQLTEATEQDLEDIKEIADDLETLSGDVLDVEVEWTVVPRAGISSRPMVGWVYLARPDGAGRMPRPHDPSAEAQPDGYVPAASTVALTGALAYEHKQLQPLLAEHLEDQCGEVLPHIFLSDVIRWLEGAALVEPEVCRSIWRRLGHAYETGDLMVRNLVFVSGIEMINPPFDVHSHALWSHLPPVLSELAHAYFPDAQAMLDSGPPPA